MRWRGGRRSHNVEDRRRATRRPGRRGFAGGGIGALVLLLAALYFGIDPRILLQTGGGPAPPAPTAPAGGQGDELADFVSVVLADTEDTWHELFERGGGRYRAPTLVLFSGRVQSACGLGEAAAGPFYCPPDERVYIDLSFYRTLRVQLGAPGDFAQAYVIAHEVGHHVQTLLGISAQVSRARQRADPLASNELSVRMELQADCLAGVWAHHAERARNILESGDIEEALNAASAIGDDRLQRRSQGYVVPDSFTHGTSEQRVRWFRRGLERGGLDACDTFRAARL